MLYYKTECPHCGNEITVNDARKEDKCRWCRRLISVSLKRTRRNKIDCKVEPIDFPEDSKPFIKNKKDDFYGY